MKPRTVAFALLALAGCSLPTVQGTLYLPDGSAVQYAAKTVDTSFLNSTTITATKTDPDINVKVNAGESAGDAGVKALTTLGQDAIAGYTFCLSAGC